MLGQDIVVAKENIIRITEYKNFFVRDSITLYFKHNDAELETLINIQTLLVLENFKFLHLLCRNLSF